MKHSHDDAHAHAPKAGDAAHDEHAHCHEHAPANDKSAPAKPADKNAI